MGLFDFLKEKNKVENENSKPEGGETIKDTDGNVYTTVKIGNQVWMVDNLKTTRYNDGTPISSITDGYKWGIRSEPRYCWYSLNTSTKEEYGALYNWYAINTGKLAPKGWHVPTDAEWTELENYLIANGYNWDGTKEGNKIAKSLAATTNWKTNSDPGTIGNDLLKNNRTGFSALPGGNRNPYGQVNDIDFNGIWWSSTEWDESTAYNRSLSSREDRLNRSHSTKSCGFSVRLLRN
jgi:uncharacterized protein (TIGR02145 family)